MDEMYTSPSYNNSYCFRTYDNYFWAGGFIGFYSIITKFNQLGLLKYYIYIGLPSIFIIFLLGLYWKNRTLGKILISSAIYLWFLLGFLCLGIFFKNHNR